MVDTDPPSGTKCCMQAVWHFLLRNRVQCIMKLEELPGYVELNNTLVVCALLCWQFWKQKDDVPLSYIIHSVYTE